MPSADDMPAEPAPKPPLTPCAAPWFGQLEQRDFDVDFYERILHRQPNEVRILRLLGELYARTGCHGKSLEVDQKLVELLPDDAVAHYNLACSLTMQHDWAAALAELHRALELGYNDFGHLEVDPDLHALRQMPQFKALAQRYGIDA
jgi:tetratricopeptide (TPR) repeat protein